MKCTVVLAAGGACVECLPGTYSDTFSNNSVCKSCPASTYSTAMAADAEAACSACMSNSHTVGMNGGTSQTSCVCNTGYQYTNLPGCTPSSPTLSKCQVIAASARSVLALPDVPFDSVALLADVRCGILPELELIVCGMPRRAPTSHEHVDVL